MNGRREWQVQQVNPEDYYPAIKPKSGKTRELPIIGPGLIKAIEQYLDVRQQASILKPNAPLLLSQKAVHTAPIPYRIICE